jgi:hypothetical protein
MSEKPSKTASEHPPTYGWSQMENLKKAEEIAKKVPEPYTVPEGYVPPTMKELWQYVRHRGFVLSIQRIVLVLTYTSSPSALHIRGAQEELCSLWK